MAVDTDVLIPRIRGPYGDEPEAIRGVLHIDTRVPVLGPDIDGITRRGISGTVRTIVHRLQVFIVHVQSAQMGGIDVPLDALQPVAVYGDARGHHMIRRQLMEDEIREWRLLLQRAHVGPEYPRGLDDGISLGAYLVLECAPRRVRRRGDAPAVDVEGKAVVDAHQAALVIDSIVQGRAAMWATFFEQAHLTSGVPEGHQLFAQEFDAHRWAIGLREFRGQQERVPIAPEQLAHGRVRPRPTYQLIVFAAQHIM